MLTFTRKASVAGSFYPSNPGALNAFLDTACIQHGQQIECVAAIVPHAGYIYSGELAGKTLASLHIPETVIILSPNHTGMGKDMAVWHKGEWETPLGNVKVNEEIADKLLASFSEFQPDRSAHLHEHSIEVQLPIIKYLSPETRIVPITLSCFDTDILEEAGKALADIVMSENCMIIASSDMSHYVSAAKAREQDSPAIEAISELSPLKFYQYVIRNRISICGVLPITATLFASSLTGAQKAVLMGYTHSGIATGDSRSVVAYAGFAIPK